MKMISVLSRHLLYMKMKYEKRYMKPDRHIFAYLYWILNPDIAQELRLKILDAYMKRYYEE